MALSPWRVNRGAMTLDEKRGDNPLGERSAKLGDVSRYRDGAISDYLCAMALLGPGIPGGRCVERSSVRSQGKRDLEQAEVGFVRGIR